MKINVTAFGYLSEKIGRSNFELEDISDIFSLKKKLENEFPGIKGFEYKVAVNMELVSGNVLIGDNSEVVLLPPFAGG